VACLLSTIMEWTAVAGHTFSMTRTWRRWKGACPLPACALTARHSILTRPSIRRAWDQLSVGSTLSDSRPSSRPVSAQSHQSGRAQRGEYRPESFLSSADRSQGPMSYGAWKSAAGHTDVRQDGRRNSAALLDRAMAVAREEALGPLPVHSTAFYGNPAATLRMGDRHTTQGEKERETWLNV